MLLRQSARRVILNILSFFNEPQNGVHILNGHYISVFNEDPTVFFDLLIKLEKKCTFINIEEAVFLINNQSKFDKCYVAFTFDDGFEECYTKIAPVLSDFKINAAFFIIPNFIHGDEAYIERMCFETLDMPLIKKPLNWAQIISLKEAGFIIGSHTLNHLRLTTDKIDILEKEIINSKRVIEERLNQSCEYFAFPYGRLSDVSDIAIKMINENFNVKFTQSNYKKYFSFNNQFINRRHFEGDWPVNHVKYFLPMKSF